MLAFTSLEKKRVLYFRFDASVFHCGLVITVEVRFLYIFITYIYYLIFINDLPNATNLYIKLFADDTFLCAQNSDIQLLEDEVNLEIEKVYRWLKSNKLTLNISKSKFMIISNKKHIKNDFLVAIDSVPLLKCDQYKYLGVVIDKNLCWKQHIEYISTKISKACGILSRLRHCLNSLVLVEIYNALIHSYVRYGIIVWGNASEATLKPLQVLINRALRIMTFAPFGRVDLKPIYRELKVLDIKDTLILETSKHMFKLKNDLLPLKFADYFTRNDFPASSSSNLYALRSNVRHNHVNIITRLQSSNKSIQVRGERLWNNISEDNRAISTLSCFKKIIKRILIENHD